MTFTVQFPADVVRLSAQIEQDRAARFEQFARAAVDAIVEEAAHVGFKKIYLYNESMDADLSRWPKSVVHRAVEIFNESGHWRARAVRVGFWNGLLIHTNWRKHHGSPVWRIRLSPRSAPA